MNLEETVGAGVPDKVPYDNPLRSEHCDCLTQVLERSAQLASFLSDCQDCGINVRRAVEENTAIAKQAAALKAKFFPNSP